MRRRPSALVRRPIRRAAAPARPPIDGSPEPTMRMSPWMIPSTIGADARTSRSRSGSPSRRHRRRRPGSRALRSRQGPAACADSARRAARCDRATARRCPRRRAARPAACVAAMMSCLSCWSGSRVGAGAGRRGLRAAEQARRRQKQRQLTAEPRSTSARALDLAHLTSRHPPP